MTDDLPDQTDPHDCQLVRACIGAKGHGGPCVTKVERLTDELADARYEIDSLRARLAQAEADLTEERALHGETARDLDESEAALARVTVELDRPFLDAMVSIERIRAAVGTPPAQCLAYYDTGLVCHLRAGHEGVHSPGSVATPEPMTTVCVHGNSPATCNDFRVVGVADTPEQGQR